MNINPAAAASIAGTARAAGKGGESDNQAKEATQQQSVSETPAGKSSESAIDAGDQAGDRGGNGRQVLDVFEHQDDSEEAAEEQSQNPARGASSDGSGEHLDLEV